MSAVINVVFGTENSKYWYRIGRFGVEQRITAVCTSDNTRFPAAMVKAHIGPNELHLVLTQTFHTFLTLAEAPDVTAGNIRVLENTLSELLDQALMGRSLNIYEQGQEGDNWTTTTVVRIDTDITHNLEG